MSGAAFLVLRGKPFFFLRLLQAESQPSSVPFYPYYLQSNRVTFSNDLAGVVDSSGGQFGDMDESFDRIFYSSECAKVG